jgi:hypothetical protein
VITILLAAARIPTGSLNVSARIGGDPNVFVRRRDCEMRDSFALAFVPDDRSVRFDVAELSAIALASNTGLYVADVVQTGTFGFDDWIGGQLRGQYVDAMRSPSMAIVWPVM